MILSAIGTFEDAMGNPVVPYFLPYTGDGIAPEGWGAVDLYFVQVFSSGGVPQFTREAVPYIPADLSAQVASAYVNEISNPQFAVVNFPTGAPYTYNFTGGNTTVSVAPNWDLVVNSIGVAAVVLEQLTPAGTINEPTNPGTILKLTSTGVTSIVLRQRIYGSPNLWGNGFLSVNFIAATYNGATPQIQMTYSQSNGTVTGVNLVTATLTADGNYKLFPGSVNIPESNSTDTDPNAYIDIDFILPPNIAQGIGISSIMASFTDINEVIIDYDQASLNRQIDHLYHYAYPIVPVGTIIDYFGFVIPLHYLFCDYSLYNRIAYNQLFNTITHVETVTLTSGMNTFTVAAGAIYSVGYGVEGVGIIAGTTITSITMNTITISSNASATGTVPVRFFAAASIIEETVTWGSSTTFTVANGAAYDVGQAISGAQIPTGTTISIIATNLITISAPSSPAYIMSNTSLVNFYDAGNGDGSTTFNIPDARRKNTVGAGGVIVSSPAAAVSGGYGIGNQLGNVGGQELHTQLTAEVGSHTHTATSGISLAAGTESAGGGSSIYTNVSSNLNPTIAANQAATAVTPFNVIQPGLVTNKCIRYQ